jgi:hypothetical protein
VSPKETFLRVAYLLQAADIPAQVAFATSRHPTLELPRERVARVNDSEAIVIECVRGEGAVILLRAHTCKRETPEEIARLVQVRQLLVDAEEVRRRAALTPEQREREDHVCSGCGLRDPLPGSDRCGHCAAKAA